MAEIYATTFLSTSLFLGPVLIWARARRRYRGAERSLPDPQLNIRPCPVVISTLFIIRCPELAALTLSVLSAPSLSKSSIAATFPRSVAKWSAVYPYEKTAQCAGFLHTNQLLLTYSSRASMSKPSSPSWRKADMATTSSLIA